MNLKTLILNDNINPIDIILTLDQNNDHEVNNLCYNVI